MKNKHITSLSKPLPDSIKLEAYKEAKEYIHINYDSKNTTLGLCLLLPVVLWDLPSYQDNNPNGDNWDYWDTSIAFPELTEEIIEEIGSCNTLAERNDLRLSYLDSFILKLSKIK